MSRLLKKLSTLFSYSLNHESMLLRRSKFHKQPIKKQVHPGLNNGIQYKFNLILHPGQKYDGLASIKFDLPDCNQNIATVQTTETISNQIQNGDLFLDFQGQSIKNIIINSHQIKDCSNQSLWQQGRILLPKKYLNSGNNHVSITYCNNYDKDGSGCVSFIDVDKKQYLYTQFQPYMANRVFPLFDQPDLKAKMKLSISCVRQWQQVISNQIQDQQSGHKSVKIHKGVTQVVEKVLNNFRQLIPDNYKTISFKETKLLSTYLYCFVVGPYKKLICSNTHKGIPMNLYCIQSLFPYMLKLAPFIEETTNRSMQFFQHYFGYPYPFSKYDQIFAHQYKWGAMQNAGIVTLNDLYIFKDPVSNEKMLSFGNTIIHELAHHWFGNLVTMKWWDDLWLNQSFAQYISHFCQQKIKNQMTTLKYQSAMVSFFNRKGWGYAQDQLITTHPIRTIVPNTDIAQSIFDGITYSKGAATMKQLMYLMGEQNFANALKQYFHKYAFKNAQLDDLLQQISKNYPENRGTNIQAWKKMWLEKQGLNILSCQITPNLDLKITQTNYHSHHATFRSHQIKIAIFLSQKQFHQIEVLVEAKNQTLIKLPSKILKDVRNFQAILLNYDDLTFAKVVIDKKSQLFFQNNLKKIDNILLRCMVWKIFADLVRDSQLKSSDFIRILVNNTFQEISDTLLEQNLNNALVCIKKYTPKQYRNQLYQDMFNHCYLQLKNNRSNISRNREIILRDKVISFTNPQCSKNIRVLEKWFNQIQSEQMGQPPNITEKWKIIVTILSSMNFKKQDKQNLLQKMLLLDQSDMMKNKKITCQVLLCSQEELDAIYQSYLYKKDWSMVALHHSLSGFNKCIHATAIRDKFRFSYMKDIALRLSEQKYTHNSALQNSQMLQVFIDGMDPHIEDDARDLDWKINQLSKIKCHKYLKLEILLKKKIDSLKKRKLCFQLY